jgi:hypothetical protein
MVILVLNWVSPFNINLMEQCLYFDIDEDEIKRVLYPYVCTYVYIIMNIMCTSVCAHIICECVCVCTLTLVKMRSSRSCNLMYACMYK